MTGADVPPLAQERAHAIAARARQAITKGGHMTERENWAQQRTDLVRRARELVIELEAITESARALSAVAAGTPEVVFLRHEQCVAAQCATCSACGMHVADDDETWRCLKCGPLSLRDQP